MHLLFNSCVSDKDAHAGKLMFVNLLSLPGAQTCFYFALFALDFTSDGRNVCDKLLPCVLFALNNGLRAGGGLGDVLAPGLAQVEIGIACVEIAITKIETVMTKIILGSALLIRRGMIPA